MIESIDREIEIIQKKYENFNWKDYFRSLNKALLTKYLKSGKYKNLYFEKKETTPKSKKIAVIGTPAIH